MRGRWWIKSSGLEYHKIFWGALLSRAIDAGEVNGHLRPNILHIHVKWGEGAGSCSANYSRLGSSGKCSSLSFKLQTCRHTLWLVYVPLWGCVLHANFHTLILEKSHAGLRRMHWKKCKAAGIEENRWGEFMDVDTLQELAKSVKGAEGDSAANVSQLEWDALKQASVNQTSHMQKLESEISKLSAHLGILLSIQPNQVLSTIQAVLAVTTVTPVTTSVSTSNL